jgi:hypothetical protein
MTRGRSSTLKRALELVGNKKALCKALWISYEELDAYLAGDKPVPRTVEAAAADLVKARQRRRSG